MPCHAATLNDTRVRNPFVQLEEGGCRWQSGSPYYARSCWPGVLSVRSNSSRARSGSPALIPGARLLRRNLARARRDTVTVTFADTVDIGISGGAGALAACTVTTSGPEDSCAHAITTRERVVFQESWLRSSLGCYESWYATLVVQGGGTWESTGGLGDCVRLQVLEIGPLALDSVPKLAGNPLLLEFLYHTRYLAWECGVAEFLGKGEEEIAMIADRLLLPKGAVRLLEHHSGRDRGQAPDRATPVEPVGREPER